MNKDPKKVEEMKKIYDELNDEQRQLVDKVLKMLGETLEDNDSISVSKDGSIVMTKGKLNVKKFIETAMKY